MNISRVKFLNVFLSLIVLSLLYSCGVQFHAMSLDPLERERKINPFDLFESRVVYENTTGDEVWGPEACGDVSFVGEGVAYEGNAIRVKWQASPECDWMGMGIGWDAWASKDLSEIMDVAAFQFKFRASEGESRVPIMIFLLEDYAEVKSAAVLRASYMESYPLNEDWRTVTVPLSDFPARVDGIDLTNIKQLIIELQGAGDVMIDDMRIVEFAASEEAAPEEKPSITAPEQLPQVIFEGSMPNGWGLEKNDCRDFRLEAGTLKMDWTGSCLYSVMGLSWNRWIGVDWSAQKEQAAIYLEGNANTDAGKLFIELEDYNYQIERLELQKYKQGNSSWLVPLSAFSEGKVNWSNLKQLRFDVEGEGNAEISAIRLQKLD
jgi:hypothetical protein